MRKLLKKLKIKRIKYEHGKTKQLHLNYYKYLEPICNKKRSLFQNSCLTPSTRQNVYNEHKKAQLKFNSFFLFLSQYTNTKLK